jgi:hypothetical protein
LVNEEIYERTYLVAGDVGLKEVLWVLIESHFSLGMQLQEWGKDP